MQRLKAASSATILDVPLQSTVSRGSEGCAGASFTSPSLLGPKAQAAVDSARDVVRRVLVNKVRQSASIENKCFEIRLH